MGTISLGVYAAWFFHDIPPPDDRDMIPEWRVSARASNPLADLQDWLVAHPLPLNDARFSVAKNDSHWNQSAAGLLTDEFKEHLSTLDVFVSTDPSSWLWRDGDAVANFAHKMPYASQLLELGKLQAIRARWFSENGQNTEAIRCAVNLIKLGHGLDGAQGTFLHHLVSITLQATGHAALEIPLSRSALNQENLADLFEEVNALQPDPKSTLFAQKAEYLTFKRIADEIQSDPSIVAKIGEGTPNVVSTPVISLEFRRNRTLSNYLSLQRPMIAAVQSDWGAVRETTNHWERTFGEIRQNTLFSMARGNFAGDTLLAIAMPTETKVLQRAFELRALHGLTLAQITLRRAELRLGHCPQAPDETPELPSDPFSLGRLCWEGKRKVIYSVGPDQTDDGGSVDPIKPTKGKDIGLLHWWK
jgi:hypothetical protein